MGLKEWYSRTGINVGSEREREIVHGHVHGHGHNLENIKSLARTRVSVSSYIADN